MQKNPASQPIMLQLPIMYVAPKRSMAYAYAYANDLETFDTARKTLEADGISVKLLYTYLDQAQNKFFGTLVLDITSAKADRSQIIDKLSHLKGVEIIDIGPAGDGVAASQENLLQVAGTQVIVIGQQFISETYRRLVEELGERAETLLFRAGEEAGRKAASGVPGLAKTLGEPLTTQ